MSTTLVLLTLNEIEGVRALYDKIPFDSVDEVFAVDGGSTDGTREFFQEKGLTVCPQKSKGRGEAFRVARERSTCDNLIFFSPDGNEDPNDIVKLKAQLDEGWDMVIASRFAKGAHNEEDDKFFKWRAWANRTFTWIANTLWNRTEYVTDTINGYRGVTKEAFDKFKLDAQGFVIEYQMSVRAMKLGLKVKEIPTNEGSRIGGESTAKSIPTGLRFLRFLFSELVNKGSK